MSGNYWSKRHHGRNLKEKTQTLTRNNFSCKTNRLHVVVTIPWGDPVKWIDSLCMVTVSRIERSRAEQSKEESYYFFLIALQLSTFNISISDVRICEKFDFGRISNCTVYPNVYKSLCTESESCCFFVCLLSPVNNITPKKK